MVVLMIKSNSTLRLAMAFTCKALWILSLMPSFHWKGNPRKFVKTCWIVEERKDGFWYSILCWFDFCVVVQSFHIDKNVMKYLSFPWNFDTICFNFRPMWQCQPHLDSLRYFTRKALPMIGAVWEFLLCQRQQLLQHQVSRAQRPLWPNTEAWQQ